jgi:hypothetical protein
MYTLRIRAELDNKFEKLAKKNKKQLEIILNQSCAGAPRCKQRGMFAPPLKIPLKEIITLNNLV